MVGGIGKCIGKSAVQEYHQEKVAGAIEEAQAVTAQKLKPISYENG
jgi:hypothetical protein